MLPRRWSAWAEEAVEANVEDVMAAGDIEVEAVHEILMN